MDHHDHLALIDPGIPGPGVWADLGSGRGAFTLALAELIGPEGRIYSVDRDGPALREQARRMNDMFPDVDVSYLEADFERELDLPPLDGLLMANALHFVRKKDALLPRLVQLLKPGGRFLLVEYNTNRGNPWVPHPLSYKSWERLASGAGLGGTQVTGVYPSRFLGEIYAAVSVKGE